MFKIRDITPTTTIYSTNVLQHSISQIQRENF